MTVKDLIAKLQQLDQSLEILIFVPTSPCTGEEGEPVLDIDTDLHKVYLN